MLLHNNLGNLPIYKLLIYNNFIFLFNKPFNQIDPYKTYSKVEINTYKDFYKKYKSLL